MSAKPKISLKRDDEIEGEVIQIDAGLVQIDKRYLLEELDESKAGLDALTAKALEYRTMMQTNRSSEVPLIHLLRISPRHMYLVKGRAALQAARNQDHTSLTFAMCYRIQDNELSHFAGFAQGGE